MYLAQCLAYKSSSNVDGKDDDDHDSMIMTTLRNQISDGCGLAKWYNECIWKIDLFPFNRITCSGKRVEKKRAIRRILQ